MRTLVYAKRNLKELLNDRLSLVFTIGLPSFLLIFIVSLNKNLGMNEAFSVENFVPSTIIFSYAFLTMFSAMLIAKDRSSSFLSRMYTSPLTAKNYILGYMIPVVIIAIFQALLLYGIGFMIGLQFSIHILISFSCLLLISMMFVSLGLLFGSVLKESQVGPIVSILIQVVAFLSGMWFSLEMVGGAFKTIGYILPFAHSVDLLKHVLSNNYQAILLPLFVVILYTVGITIFSILLFKKNMVS